MVIYHQWIPTLIYSDYDKSKEVVWFESYVDVGAWHWLVLDESPFAPQLAIE